MSLFLLPSHWGCTSQCTPNCRSQAWINRAGCIWKGIRHNKPKPNQISGSLKIRVPRRVGRGPVCQRDGNRSAVATPNGEQPKEEEYVPVELIVNAQWRSLNTVCLILWCGWAILHASPYIWAPTGPLQSALYGLLGGQINIIWMNRSHTFTQFRN